MSILPSTLTETESAGGRSVEIVLSSGTETGHVFLNQGKVLHAEVGELGGEEAFYALMRWRSGTFRTRPLGGSPELTIQTSVMSLLMEGARQMDEGSDQPGDE
ncbi:DUF4388 domain-containing protein [Verrucomicrobiota bacterium]